MGPVACSAKLKQIEQDYGCLAKKMDSRCKLDHTIYYILLYLVVVEESVTAVFVAGCRSLELIPHLHKVITGQYTGKHASTSHCMGTGWSGSDRLHCCRAIECR